MCISSDSGQVCGTEHMLANLQEDYQDPGVSSVLGQRDNVLRADVAISTMVKTGQDLGSQDTSVHAMAGFPDWLIKLGRLFLCWRHYPEGPGLSKTEKAI